jgi:hypothetical protein
MFKESFSEIHLYQIAHVVVSQSTMVNCFPITFFVVITSTILQIGGFYCMTAGILEQRSEPVRYFCLDNMSGFIPAVCYICMFQILFLIDSCFHQHICSLWNDILKDSIQSSQSPLVVGNASV